MTWTTPADLRAQVQKLWDKGDLLRTCVQGEVMPPRRLRLTGPGSTDLSERFDEVRVWMKALGCHALPGEAPRYRIVLREFRHRVLGACAVPDAVWLDSLDDALALIGKQQEARRFASLMQTTRAQQPALLQWLEKRPLNALALADAWPCLLAVVAWLQAHPRPGIYLRQVDLPGVDSKFIEAHATGVGQFCQRYGFKDKPLRIRFRLLDASVSPFAPAELPSDADQDITLTQADFARLVLPVQRVFFTENEVNFLAFPPLPGSLVIFGAGYGFEMLAGARWLHGCQLYYWGDIDTHGFAILDQLRVRLPQVQSLLMDRATLLAHQSQWGNEPQPVLRVLPRLDAAEAALLDDLRSHRLGVRVRLEQERLGFEWVKAALAATDSEMA
jgi:hypothetical protein